MPQNLGYYLNKKQILEQAIRQASNQVAWLHINWSSAAEFQNNTPKNKIRRLLLNTFRRKEHTCFSLILWKQSKNTNRILLLLVTKQKLDLAYIICEPSFYLCHSWYREVPISPQIFTSAVDELMPLKADYPHSRS